MFHRPRLMPSLKGDNWLAGDVMDAMIIHFTIETQQPVHPVPLTVATGITNGETPVECPTLKEASDKSQKAVAVYHQNGNHWCALIIDFQTMIITYYDPLCETEAMMKKIQRNWNRYCRYYTGTKSFRVICPEKAPRQSDGHNCGIFTLEFISKEVGAGYDLLTPEEGREVLVGIMSSIFPFGVKRKAAEDAVVVKKLRRLPEGRAGNRRRTPPPPNRFG